MAGGGGGTENGEPEFQIAPMIDVLLVMLIFFMVITSSQVLRVDKSIKLPVAPNAQKKDNQRSEALVNAAWDGKKPIIKLDDRPYDKMADLVPVLKARKGNDPKYRVVIRGDKDLPALVVAQIMNSCGEAGISDIAFSATNRAD